MHHKFNLHPLSILSGLFALFFITVTIWSTYLSPDARYARDNLEYLSSTASEMDLGISSCETHGLHSLLYPLPYTVSQICTLSDNWTNGYIQALKSIKADPDRYSSLLIETYSPYDTLSRLVLTANSTDVQAAYDEVQLCAGITSVETQIDGLYINSLNSSATEKQTLATQGIYSLWVTMLVGCCLSLLSVISFLLCLHRFPKK